jgi:tetratricopeptide (TPR) repeat protein
VGDVRRFVHSLSGAEGDLHDYLAEEVIGDLDPDLQDFLMKTSVLHTVNQSDASIVAGLDLATSRRLISEAERHGLLGRRTEPLRSSQAYHPLVREFLEHRFVREAGASAVQDAHVLIASASEETQWDLACFHYAAAGRADDIHRVIRRATPRIMGTGKFELAAGFLATFPAQTEEFEFEVIRSRADFQAGHSAAAFESAERALELRPDSELAAVNALSLRVLAGNLKDAEGLAHSLDGSGDPHLRAIAAATTAMLQLSVDGNLSRFVSDVTELAEEQGRAGFRHYEGVSLLNAASALKAQGAAAVCLSYASRAIDLLASTSAGHEVVSAKLVRAWALAHLGRWDEATTALSELKGTVDSVSRGEALTEMALIELWYGQGTEVPTLLQRAEPWLRFLPDVAALWLVAAMEKAVQLGKYDEAAQLGRRVKHGVLNAEPGLTVHAIATAAYLAVREGKVDALTLVGNAAALAERQEAGFWARYCRTLAVFLDGAEDFADRLRDAIDEDHAFLSILAELVTSRLEDLDQPILEIVAEEARQRPQRWRSLLRAAIDASSPARWYAARVLDQAGEANDIPRLRTLARSASVGAADRSLGKALARRLAPRVFVEDQGRVSIMIGRDVVLGTNVRRKVLSLLCFLVSRQGFAATRDQVLDALWPDLEPAVALNSLNQTVYFLRRVFEADYQDDHSAGYVRHDSNLIWLDQELVQARSSECRSLIQRSWRRCFARRRRPSQRDVPGQIRTRLCLRGMGDLLPGLPACLRSPSPGKCDSSGHSFRPLPTRDQPSPSGTRRGSRGRGIGGRPAQAISPRWCSFGGGRAVRALRELYEARGRRGPAAA